jgi:hypothetical protein
VTIGGAGPLGFNLRSPTPRRDTDPDTSRPRVTAAFRSSIWGKLALDGAGKLMKEHVAEVVAAYVGYDTMTPAELP